MNTDKTIFLTVEETARELRVSKAHVYDLMREGKLPFVMVGCVRRVPRAAIEALASKAMAGAPA